MVKKSIKVYQGGTFRDERGSVSFVNDFNFKDVKRFYQIENSGIDLVRAFHGHMKEEKYVYVAFGSILLCIVPLTSIKNPSKNAKVERFILSAEKPQIIYIPFQYANGFKALESNTKVVFFSTVTLEESLKDDYRFPYDYWGADVWK